jgi:hypothetical protein
MSNANLTTDQKETYYREIKYVRFLVLMAVAMKMTAFCDIALCSLAEVGLLNNTT